MADSDSTVPQPVNAFRTLRFYFRLLVGTLLIVGMAVGWWAMQRQKAAAQRSAAERIERLGGEVYREHEWQGRQPLKDPLPPRSTWLQQWLGDEIFQRVVAVDLSRVTQLDRAAELLPRLPFLACVGANGTDWSDPHMAVFARMGQLDHLDLSATLISDDGLRHLSGLVHLKTLDVSDTPISDEGLQALIRLRGLRELDLRNTRVTSAAVERFSRRRPHCKILRNESEEAGIIHG